MALTAKQQRFVDEYLIDLNATQAAIRAGYSGKTARQAGAENLSKPNIAAEVAKRQQDRQKRTEITQDRVLQELARIAFFDIRRLYNEDGTMKAPHELDDEAAAVLSGIDVQEEVDHADTQDELEGQPHGGALKRRRGKTVIGYTKKAKVFDKGTALQLAMRHLGMLNDKLEHSGGVTVTVKDYTGRKKDDAAD